MYLCNHQADNNHRSHVTTKSNQVLSNPSLVKACCFETQARQGPVVVIAARPQCTSSNTGLGSLDMLHSWWTASYAHKSFDAAGALVSVHPVASLLLAAAWMALHQTAPRQCDTAWAAE
jgi:hypothetical protein